MCVCVLLWTEIAASAGREQDKVGLPQRDQQAAVRGGGGGKWEDEESGVRGLSGRHLWEGRVI